jgi:hypothetical protein
MATRLRKVITAIDANGTPFSEVHTETLVSEKWYANDPVTLDLAGPEADAWKELYNASALAECSGLRSQVVHKNDAIAALTKQVEELTTELATYREAVRNPREISPAEFLQRVSDGDKIAIMQSRDPRCMAAMWTLFTTQFVNLDSPVLASLIDALIEAGIDIDDTERARIFA